MKSTQFDVIIVGAGPAGIIAAIQLAKQDLNICLLEKSTFPRDKICGDALSVDVLNQLEKIDLNFAKRFELLIQKTPSSGVKIVAPNQQFLDIPFYYKGDKKFGYICKRMDFDNFLFQELKQFNNITVVENCKVKDIVINDNEVIVSVDSKLKNQNTKFKSKIIIGADGAQSIVNKKTIQNKVNHKHYSAGLRVYYKNVTNFHEENFIELHFFKDILPGYLWIFPLPNNEANVGIGMLSSYVSKKKVNLKKTLQRLIKKDPNLKERFKNAEALEKVKGFGLPLGAKKRKISDNRVLLLGDAAGLIDPFSGEGIGNAIRSGRVAAEQVKKCFKNNDFSQQININYDKEIYRLMQKEFQISRTLQNLCKYPRLFNMIIKKANKNEALREFLIETLEDVEKKKLLTKPSFYYRLLFK